MTQALRVAVALALVLGCHSSEEPGPPPTCVGDCGLPPGAGVGMPEENPDAGMGEGGSSGAVTLTGKVLQLNDQVNFVSGVPFNGAADLQTQGHSGRTVKGTWDGSNPFVIENVTSAAPIWVLGTPQNPLADDVLPGLEPVRTDEPDAQGLVTADFALVRASTIDLIYDLATVPTANDATKAQVILRLVDKTSTSADAPPLAGVTVKASSAALVMYGTSGSFSDVATATDPTGVVILVNVGAAAWPGALVSLEFSGARKGGAVVHAVTGAVTLSTLGL